MNKRQHAKNSVILLEMIINILLFSVLLVVGLTFFIKTHTMTKDTKLLHQAVTCCDNAATVFESSNADSSVFAAQYPDCVISDEKIFIYYDNDFKECSAKDSVYKVIVSLSSLDRTTNAHIQFLDKDNSEIFTITTSIYAPLTAEHTEVAQ